MMSVFHLMAYCIIFGIQRFVNGVLGLSGMYCARGSFRSCI